MDLAPKLNNEKANNIAFKDIKKYLIENFLYNGDLESMNILLNLYNIYESIENIFPRYVTLENLRVDIIKFLRNKQGIELIARSLSNLIHDDINRLELYLYLEGYRLGFNSKKYANQLEVITLNSFSLGELYNRKKLFNYEFNNIEVLTFKRHMFNELRHDKNVKNFIKSTLKDMHRVLLSNKISDLNQHLDLQLVFKNENNDVKIKEVDAYLTREELYFLNKKIFKFLYVDGFRIFRNGFWDGINDKVMKRYK
ncbi:hypothetical protein ABID14_000035 [Peptoniphilus olsenii]|uniref:Uncharacterized protein n=1 Tax=Peptoniphilus olsenii TaxID=411570 RepID=A0ABV2J923_9FIRM